MNYFLVKDGHTDRRTDGRRRIRPHCALAQVGSNIHPMLGKLTIRPLDADRKQYCLNPRSVLILFVILVTRIKYGGFIAVWEDYL